MGPGFRRDVMEISAIPIGGGIVPFGERTMQRSGRIVRYTIEELQEMRRRGETLTDRDRAARTTYEEVEAQIAADPDEAGMVYDWANATTVMPKPKADVHMRIDGDVLDWFRQSGKGYQTRINAVLRSYVTHMRKREAG
jgi:uncharacterized protein (DUF4415 family)